MVPSSGNHVPDRALDGSPNPTLVQHDAGTLTTSDGLTLATRRWIPHAEPQASVLIAHGLSEHSGRYAHVAAHLLLNDLAVYGYDHRHHGRSAGQPRAFVDRFQDLVDDLALVIDWVTTEAPQRPLFLFGHSLGGAVATRYIAQNGGEALAGLILSSPALQIPEDFSPLLQRVAPIVSRLFPRLPTTKRDRAFLSRDPAVMKSWNADPLTYKGGLRARTGYQILMNTRDLLDHTDVFTMPLLVLHGTDDNITSPKGSKLFYERVPTSDKTLWMLDGGYHETFNDLDQEKALEDLASWLLARI